MTTSSNGLVTRVVFWFLRGLLGLIFIVLLTLGLVSIFSEGIPNPMAVPGPEPKPETCKWPGWRTEIAQTEKGEWICLMRRGQAVKIFFY